MTEFGNCSFDQTRIFPEIRENKHSTSLATLSPCCSFSFFDSLGLFYSLFGTQRSLPYKSIIERVLKCSKATNFLKGNTLPAFIPFILGLLDMADRSEEEKKEPVQVMARTFVPSDLACLHGPYTLRALVCLFNRLGFFIIISFIRYLHKCHTVGCLI